MITLLYNIDECEQEVRQFLDRYTHVPIESVGISKDDDKKDIEMHLRRNNSEYIYLFNRALLLTREIFNELTDTLIEDHSVDVAITQSWCRQSDGSDLPYDIYDRCKNIRSDKSFALTQLTDIWVQNHINYIGNIGTMLFHKEAFLRLLSYVDLRCLLSSDEITGLNELSKGATSSVIRCRFMDHTSALRTTYEIEDKNTQSIFSRWHFTSQERRIHGKEDKLDITFFYTDMGEYFNLKPLADFADSSGHKVHFTRDIKEKAKVGVYCQHHTYPENSDFSVILLHDMAQGHNRWPNFWYAEPWDKYDLGITPGSLFSSLYKKTGNNYYSNPTYGVYEFGYPKSDIIYDKGLDERAKNFKKKLGFKYDYTVLYAVSWEYFDKEDDFVRAVASLPVNMLIKQSDWSDDYMAIKDSIKKMRSMHEGKYDNIYYLEPEESILTALKMCDMVVSDESSVMLEALMFNKPSVGVTDWMIPDTDPPRPSSIPLDYCFRIKKVELREYVERMSKGLIDFGKYIDFGDTIFANKGHVCEDIMNAIEYYTGVSDNDELMSKRILPDYYPFI